MTRNSLLENALDIIKARPDDTVAAVEAFAENNGFVSRYNGTLKDEANRRYHNEENGKALILITKRNGRGGWHLSMTDYKNDLTLVVDKDFTPGSVDTLETAEIKPLKRASLMRDYAERTFGLALK
jgi:hypothetical protein